MASFWRECERTSMSFYAPSWISEILLLVGVLCGFGGSDLIAWQLDIGAGVGWGVLVVVMVVLCGGSGFFAYGCGLNFDRTSRELAVRRRLFGLSVGGQRKYPFDEVDGLYLGSDDEGFPVIRLELSDGRRFRLFSLRAVKDHERLQEILWSNGS